MSSERIALAVDLGGTNLRTGAVTRNGDVICSRRAPTPAREPWERTVDVIAEHVASLRSEIAQSGIEIAGIGIGAPGPLDVRTGIVFSSPNFPLWFNVPLASAVGERTGLPVRVENDADAAALAEARWGSGAGVTDFIYLTIGTGLGSSLIINGRAWHGVSGIAAEAGHITIEAQGRLCGCGNTGCWESYVSGWAIVQRTKELLSDTGRSPQWSRGALEPHIVADAALAGDTLAQRVYQETGRYLGIGIASLVNLLNPGLIVIGGGVSAAGHLLLDPARDELHRRAFSTQAQAVRIERAALKEPGLIGAAAIVYSDL